MNFKENQSKTKLRGGYYTPLPIASFLAKWILKKKSINLLEPSCGDGVFIQALNQLTQKPIRFTGVELLSIESEKALAVAQSNEHLNPTIINGDFLAWAISELEKGSQFDGILGNPPYIRYQYLSNEDQLLAQKIFARYKLAFTKHTNAWVPFVIASIGLLAPGGHLAMVIPSELLHILHASSLRNFMLDQCLRILMIDPNELLFEDTLQGTILLMIEKKTSAKQKSKGVAVVAAPNNDFLNTNPQKIFLHAQYVSGDVLNEKWIKVLLEKEALDVFEKVCNLPSIKRFSEVANVEVGIVTGANDFFLVNNKVRSQYRLKQFAKPIFGRGGQCPGVIYSHVMHKINAKKGAAINFIDFGKVEYKHLPAGARKYIREGENQNLHTRFKCSIRKPWYNIPSVFTTNLGMPKRAHNYPRLIFNPANAYTTDTTHRITSKIDPETLAYCFINSLTALTAEMEGRHYGGGALELVPSEIKKLLLPIVNVPATSLAILNTEISHQHNPDQLLLQQDSKVLIAAGLTDHECKIIHKAWIHLRSRRQRLLGTSPESLES